MNKKVKRIPVNSVGKLIKEAREKKELSIEDLVWKINKPKKVTAELIKKWEKGQEFPNLDCIYLLAENLDLNPNELFQKRLTIQDESIHEVDWAERRVSERMLHVTKNLTKVVVEFVGIILAILLGMYASHFIRMMTDPNDLTQQQIVINVIDDAVNQSTSGKIQNGSVNNTINSIKNVVEQ